MLPTACSPVSYPKIGLVGSSQAHNRRMEPENRAIPLRRFLTVAEVAEMLSLTTDDVEGLLDSGEIPAIRIGPDDAWRVEQAVLDGYLEAKYEEARRSALWNGFDFGAITDFDPASRPLTPGSETRDDLPRRNS
jgi:excisionase family DNA binding protein